jgi:16S rRNA C967 or C1407 C5-methylase (RsmB/RsmF family)/NOL1/NOP2/fmu family ribosome biogenesis protein
MKYPLPESFVNRIKTQFPSFYQELANSLEEVPEVSIRVNPLKKSTKISRFQLSNLSKINWAENGFYLPERPKFIFDPLFHAGAYYVQEASSMVLETVFKQILGVKKGNVVLDLCAAPGGKSTLIQSLLSNNDLLVSNEVIKSRAGILKENLVKWGGINTVITNNDPKDFTKFEVFFDIIVVDAPCSGEGMFRKEPHSRNEWSEENVNLCSNRQQRILSDVLPSLKPGGFLIYSTCTFAEIENRKNCEWLVETESLKSVRINNLQNFGVIEELDKNIHTYHFYQNYIKGEGFFMACFQKSENEKELKTLNLKGVNKPNFKQIDAIKSVVNNIEDYIVWQEKEKIFAYPSDLSSIILFLKQKLRVLYAGTELGEIIHEKLIPSHELAMSSALILNSYSVDFNEKEALVFLKKEDVSNFQSVQNAPNGWCLVKYNGLNLGWIKKIGNRTNNYLPKELRILKDLE